MPGAEVKAKRDNRRLNRALTVAVGTKGLEEGGDVKVWKDLEEADDDPTRR